VYLNVISDKRLGQSRDLRGTEPLDVVGVGGKEERTDACAKCGKALNSSWPWEDCTATASLRGRSLAGACMLCCYYQQGPSKDIVIWAIKIHRDAIKKLWGRKGRKGREKQSIESPVRGVTTWQVQKYGE